MKIRAYRDADWSEWRRMTIALFPEYSAEELERGMREFRARSDADVFVAEREDGSPAGYVEVGSRSYADGCDTSPVGYIEAWYVDPDVRGTGYGRALLEAAEDWAHGWFTIPLTGPGRRRAQCQFHAKTRRRAVPPNPGRFDPGRTAWGAPACRRSRQFLPVRGPV